MLAKRMSDGFMRAGIRDPEQKRSAFYTLHSIFDEDNFST